MTSYTRPNMYFEEGIRNIILSFKNHLNYAHICEINLTTITRVMWPVNILPRINQKEQWALEVRMQQNRQHKVMLLSGGLSVTTADISLTINAKSTIRVCIASLGKWPKWDHLYSHWRGGDTQRATLLALKRNLSIR